MDYQRNIVTPCITAATMYLDINKARPDQIVTLGGLWWSIMPRIALGDYSWGLIGKTILKCSQSLFSAKVVFSHRLPGSISAATAVTSVLIIGNKVVLTGWKMTELLIFYTQYNLSDSENSVPGVAGPCPGQLLSVCPTLSRLSPGLRSWEASNFLSHNIAREPGALTNFRCLIGHWSVPGWGMKPI